MQQIQRAVPLVHQVYEYIKNKILTGVYQPRERIVETKLASELKISRSPVREAIRLLIANHLLVQEADGIHVFRPTQEDFFEIYDLRLAIEPAAARRAAELRSSSHLKLIEQNLKSTEVALTNKDMSGVVSCNDEFHRLVWEASGNTWFVRSMETISIRVQYYWHLVLNVNGQQTNILRAHTAIFDSLRRGNADEAYDSMHQHIMKDLVVINEHVRAGHSPFRA